MNDATESSAFSNHECKVTLTWRREVCFFAVFFVDFFIGVKQTGIHVFVTCPCTTNCICSYISVRCMRTYDGVGANTAVEEQQIQP